MYKKSMLLIIPLLVISSIELNVTTSAATPIKIGVIGPYYMPTWGGTQADPTAVSADVGGGMWPGANLAAREINAAGGINASGTMTPIQLVPANDWSYDPSTGTNDTSNAIASVTDLLEAGTQFIVGGFNTQVAQPIIETVMDWNTGNPSPVAFFIVGDPNDATIRNLTEPQTYARYKWLFRVMPVNNTILFNEIVGHLGGYLLPKKLIPMYASSTNTVRFAVVVEDFPYTQAMMYALTTPAWYRDYFGPNATEVYSYRAPVTTTDFTLVLDAIEAAGAHLIITCFSQPMANILVSQLYQQQRRVLVVGFDVFGECMSYWEDTQGACSYECMINWAGTNATIVPGLTDVFWNNFVGNYSVWPLYTAAGAYDAIYGLKEAMEKAETTDPNALLPVFEATDRIGVLGRFKYTAWHDVYSERSRSADTTWTDGYCRAMMVQWVNGSTFSPPASGGAMTVVSPTDQSYSRKTLIPPWMYPLAYWDVNFDGRVNIVDVASAANAYKSRPEDARWNMEADVNLDGEVNILDIAAIAGYFGQTAPSWPLP